MRKERSNMTVQERIRLCRLIEQTQKHPEYARALGVEDKSTFNGKKEEVTVRRERRMPY